MDYGIRAMLIGVFLLLAHVLQGQDFIVRQDRLDVYDGLSDNTVHQIAFDSARHLVWLATDDGLTSYDGYSFTQYNKFNSVFRSNYVWFIQCLGDGTLVALTVQENEPFVPDRIYLLAPGSSAWISQDAFARNLPAGLRRNQMSCVGRKCFLTTHDNQWWIYDLDQQVFTPGPKPDSFFIEGLVNQYLLGWIGNRLKVVHVSDPKKILDHPAEDHPDPHVDALLRHWQKVVALPGPPVYPTQSSWYDVRRRILWFAHDAFKLSGFYDNGNPVVFHDGQREYLIKGKINGIQGDAQDMLYVYTDNGLYMLRLERELFSNYFMSGSSDQDQSQERNSYRGMVVADGQLYVNARNRFIRQSLLNPADQEVIASMPYFLYPMIPDGDGLLLGRKELIRYHPANGSLEIFDVLRDTPGEALWSVFKTGHLLYLGLQRGVYVIRAEVLTGQTLEVVCPEGAFADIHQVYQIMEDQKGRLWFVSRSGLYTDLPGLCRPKRVIFRDITGRVVPLLGFTHLSPDTDSTWWVASMDGGVAHITLRDTIATVLRRLKQDDGLPTNTCYAAYPDPTGHVWISTNAGLVKLRKWDWTFRVYTTEDGLPDNEFNRISHFRDQEGHLFFGGLSGIVRVDPEKMNQDEEPSIHLHILGIHQFSGWADSIVDRTQEVLAGQDVVFHPDDKFIQIEVGLSDLFHTAHHRFEYRLKDTDSDWLAMNDNRLTVPFLSYGKHVVEIRGRNRDGVLSRNTLVVPIFVLRPLYLRAWFLAVVLVGIFLVVREVFLGRTRRMVWRAQALEDQVQQRTQTITAQAEELRQLHKARTRFFANISHELRTPLTLIKGPVDSLLQDARSEKEKQYLDIIRHQAQRLRERIDELLQLAKADAQQLTLKPIPVQLNSFLTRLTNIFAVSVQTNGIHIQLNNHQPANEVVLTDRQKLEQILSNFIQNAIRFSSAGKSITLDCRRVGESLVFQVTDEGPGISRENLEKVFDRFYSGGHEDSREEGHGIGLALCREFARVMDGRVWAESTPGNGSTFFLQLPYALADVTASEEELISYTQQHDPVTTPESSEKASGSSTIMIVEDNLPMQSFLGTELNDFRILRANNGNEALEQLVSLRQQHALPDLVLTDVMMPEMDGFELVRQLRTMKELSRIPVIMLTARAGHEDKLEALRIGVDDYIPKPFDMEELRLRITSILSRLPFRKEAMEQQENVNVVDMDWLRELEKEVRSHLQESQFTVSQLAYQLHISERQLFRRIKALTGLTPNAYIREARLYEAKTLLESGAYSTVASLAGAVGFEDPDYFSRLFRERFGFRPSAQL